MKLLRRLRSLRVVLLTLAWFGLCYGLVLAQSPSPPAPIPGAPTVPGTVSGMIAAVSLALVPAFTWLVRAYVLPKIPRILIPLVIVPGISSAITYVTTLMTGGTVSWLGIAGLSAGAVYLRELLSTLQEHGVNS